MRRGVVLFAICATAILLFLVNQVWTLLTLLVKDGHEDIISKAELPELGSKPTNKQSQIIPKIIHQTYINTSIPEVWQEAQKSCIDLHPDWEYKLWTDEMSLQFIHDEYPWFEETFKNYPYPIERADAIRYFVLRTYGGVYLDLDDGCNREMEPLLSYPAWVRKTMPTGISNDAMGAVPEHPFFVYVTEQIKSYDRNWLLPYITVMGSTGPLFLSVLWRHWVSLGGNVGDGPDGGRVRIIFPEEYNGHDWSFFTHHLGNSWHAADVQLIFWVSAKNNPSTQLLPCKNSNNSSQMARNWVLVTLIGFGLGGSLIFLCWWSYHRYVLAPHPAAADIPKWKSASIRSKWPFWRRASAQKEYELVSRHEV
jgi:mannosyltransferase OCH1-like enzyme